MDARASLSQRALRSQGRLLSCTRLPQAHGLLALDLTMPQFKTLVLLDARGSMTAGQLARALGVGLSTMTGVVDRLCEQELVTRGEDPDDRRATRVRLSQAGRATVERFHETRRQAFSQVLDRLSLEELELAARAIDLLADAAEALAGEATDADEADAEPALGGRQ